MTLTHSRSSDLPEEFAHLALQRKALDLPNYKLGDLEKLRERYKAIPEKVETVISLPSTVGTK